VATDERSRSIWIRSTGWVERPWREVRREVIEHAERRYLEAVLTATRGRIGEAARRAGMAPRSLHEKMRKYGLLKEHYRIDKNKES